MKVALVTDTHFGARNDNEALANFFEKFYVDIFFPYLNKNNIKNIIHLGDAFDRRKYINFQSLYRCKQYFYDLAEKFGIHIDQIIGNHDTFYKNTNKINSPDLILGEYANINTYSEPQELILGGKKLVMMPWICADNHDKAMKLISESDADIVLGHLELDGFEMYRGQPHHGGFAADVFSRFDLVLSGHFHHRSTNRNITYLGTPYEITWSDYNDPKGFHILDLDTNELTFIENPYRLFHKVKYDDSTWKDMESFKNLDFTHLKDTYVKVIVINKTNPYWFDLFIDKIEKCDPIDVQVVDDNLSLDLIKDDDLMENVDDTMTILYKSIETMAVDVDKTRLDVLFKSLYNEALDI
jgi:DNA repair exonuclease SbcCD nuclease subunit